MRLVVVIDGRQRRFRRRRRPCLLPPPGTPQPRRSGAGFNRLHNDAPQHPGQRQRVELPALYTRRMVRRFLAGCAVVRL